MQGCTLPDIKKIINNFEKKVINFKLECELFIKSSENYGEIKN